MLSYVIKSVVYLSLMYIPYMLLLKKESFFRFNRLMLILVMLLSLVLPWVNIPAISWGDYAVSVYLESGSGVVVESTDAGNTAGLPTSVSVNWWGIIGYLYIIGVAITLLIKMFQLGMLYRKIHQGVLWTEVKDGIRLFCHADDVSPFSWFNSIVISQADYENDADAILCHEREHVRAYHSWDILLLNLVQTVQWFNPLAWIMGTSLRDVHEYEADDAVLAGGIEGSRYQYLLIRKAVGTSPYAFANSFNHSLLTKRITMMLRKKSNPWMRTKGLYVVLVASIALSAFATPELNQQVDKLVGESQSMSKGMVSNDFQNMERGGKTTLSDFTDGQKKTKMRKLVKAKKVEDVVQCVVSDEQKSKAEYMGGHDEMMKFLAMHLKYPIVARDNGVEGNVQVTFTVGDDGSLVDVKGVYVPTQKAILQNDMIIIGYKKADAGENGTAGANEEQLAQARKALVNEAIRVVSLMPKWTPARKDGKQVSSSEQYMCRFRLK